MKMKLGLLSLIYLINISFASEFKGELAFEFRQFKEDHNSDSVDQGQSIFGRAQNKYEIGSSEVNMRAFFRNDFADSDRRFVAIEDLHYVKNFGEEEDKYVLVGYKLFNWTSMEAFHPGDIINSRNFDSDVENFEKLGELTLSYKQEFEDTTLSFFYFPRFESPIFPGDKSRLGLGVDPEEAELYINGVISKGKRVEQGGMRFTNTIENTDYSLFVIKHVDRENPLFELNPFTLEFTPSFFSVTQAGGTVTHISENGPIYKLETTTKTFDKVDELLTFRGVRKPRNHTKSAVGIEYGMPLENGHEVTFYSEVQGIIGLTKEERAEQDFFQNDLFIGARYVLHDKMGTEFFLSGIKDLERENEQLFNFSVARRLSDEWKFKSGLRVVNAPQKEDLFLGLEQFHEDNFAYFNLIRFF